MTETDFQTTIAPPQAGLGTVRNRGGGGRSMAGSRVRSVIKHALLIAASLVMIYPLLWLVVSSFRPTDVIFKTPGLWLNNLILDNYSQGWNALAHPFGHYIINSAIVVIGAVAGNLFACSLAAYAFAR